jgi:hypothetical protein
MTRDRDDYVRRIRANVGEGRIHAYGSDWLGIELPDPHPEKRLKSMDTDGHGIVNVHLPESEVIKLAARLLAEGKLDPDPSWLMDRWREVGEWLLEHRPQRFDGLLVDLDRYVEERDEVAQ